MDYTMLYQKTCQTRVNSEILVSEQGCCFSGFLTVFIKVLFSVDGRGEVVQQLSQVCICMWLKSTDTSLWS